MSTSQKSVALQYFAVANNSDLEGLRALLSPSFTHIVLPASLGGMGKPSRNKEEYLDFVEKLMIPCAKWFKFLDPIEVIEAPDSDTVVVHIKSTGLTHQDQPINGEYIYIFRVEGDKILQVKEFRDASDPAGRGKSEQ